MIFPSFVFLFAFLPIVLLLWWSRLPLGFRLGILVFASYVFYGWWDYRFVGLIVVSTLLDYTCGAQIAVSAGRRRWAYLMASVVGNLAILGFFKYCDFFITSVAAVLEQFGAPANLQLLGVTLPVGISFYTFQTMSYSLDIYRGQARPARDLLHFSAYVSMFPQLVAGPIVRYQELEQQLSDLHAKTFNHSEFAEGVWYFVLGLSKKLLIADSVAPSAQLLFDGGGPVGFGAAWIGTLSYTVQLYFDFSGYSDMAVGLGLMLGFRMPANFNSPYKASDISDFWRRWHITFSTFLRDYLFIPLGGSRLGTVLTLRNLFITMFLGGLWHGAQWTFVVWGLYHGLLLGVNAVWRSAGARLPRATGVVLTFLLVHLGWVLFRAPSFSRAQEVWMGLVDVKGLLEPWAQTYPSLVGPMPSVVLEFGGLVRQLVLAGALGIAFWAPNSIEVRKPVTPAWGAMLGLLFAACLYQMVEEVPFLYFQF